MPIEIILIIIGITFIGTFVKSAFGFGEGLVSMALLSFVVGLDFSAPYIAICTFSSSAFIMLRDRKDIHFSGVKMFLIGAILLAPLGIFAADILDERLLKKVLGGLITIFAIYSLLQPKLQQITDKKGVWAIISGAIGGFLGGAYNIAGPPIVIYANMKAYSPSVFRATMQGFFTPLSLFVILGHWTTGHINSNIMYSVLWALPLMLIGISLGKRLNKQIKNPNKFRRIIFIMLLVIGVMMLLK